MSLTTLQWNQDISGLISQDYYARFTKVNQIFFYVLIFILLRAKGVNHSNPEKESNDTNNNHSVNQSTLCVIKSQIFQVHNNVNWHHITSLAKKNSQTYTFIKDDLRERNHTKSYNRYFG